MNNKECQKKVAKKNKKKLSEKDNSPKSNKQKKIEINENNYILDFSENGKNVLTIAKKQ